MSPPPDLEVCDEDEEDQEDLDDSEESEDQDSLRGGVLWPDPFDTGTDASTGDEAPRAKLQTPSAPQSPPGTASGIVRRGSPWPHPSENVNRELPRPVRTAPAATLATPSAPSCSPRGEKRKGVEGEDQPSSLKSRKKSSDMDVESVPDFERMSSVEMTNYVQWWRKMHAINWQNLKKELASSSKGV
eukprot:Skav214577  [mRNA]  locus=scaffold57:171894:176728:+ [translate_table: standard]